MKELRFHGELIVTGVGSLDYLEEISSQRVFIVTGKGSMFKNGTIDKIKSIFKKKGAAVEIHSGVPANPTTDDVLAGLEKMKGFNPDILIGVGGGSAIDASKVMCLFYEYPELDFESAINKPLPVKREKIKFIAIPSTSGTGTEVTRAAVITYREKNIKIGLKSNAFIPDIAILDANITLSMPPGVVAETGMDAVTHAVECYINKNIDDFTETLARGAVEGLFKYLPLSYENGDITSRQKVHNYQCLAGSAFTNVGLGMAHGISHAVGGMFDYGHGLINGVSLPYVLEYNATRDKEVAERLHRLAELVKVEDFIYAVRGLNKKLGIPASFKEMGIPQGDFEDNFELLVVNSLKGSTRKNPVNVTKEDMKSLLKRIYRG